MDAAIAAALARPRVKWDSLVGFVLIHLAALAAFFTFNWKAFWVFFILQWVTGG